MSEVERVPFVLPPVPSTFVVAEDGAVTQLEEPPAVEWLEGYVRSFSPTSLRLLKVCPEAWRQRYILGRKERPAGHLTLGTGVHGALAYNFEQKLDSHEDRPVTEVVTYFHDKAWPEAVEKDGGVDEIYWKDGTPDDHRRDGERMTIAYHKAVAPRIQPVEKPEQKISLFVEGVPVPVIGYLDLVEEANVADVKTGKQVQRKPDGNWRFQGAIYSLAKKKPTHFHSVSRAKTPSIATPLTDPEMAIPYRDDIAAVTRQVLVDFARQIEYFMHTYGPDSYWPTTGVFMDYKGGPACRFCGFRKTCPAWEWERTVEVHP